jgi:pilus assembly protein CpaC
MRNNLLPTRLVAVPAWGLVAASLLAMPASAAARRPVAVSAPARTEAPAPQPTTPQPAATQSGATQSALIVEAGAGRVITLPAPVTNVFVSDPKIVEVRPASPTSLFLFGVSAGRTSVAALDANGETVRQYEVTVRTPGFGATEAAGTVNRTTPGANVRVDAQPRRLAVTGKVATPNDAQSAAAAASAFAAEGQAVDNKLQVAGQIQVGLHVRIAEMSRNVTRAMGINWQAIGNVGKLAAAFSTANPIGAAGATRIIGSLNDKSGNSITGLIDALAVDNLVHVLAEPNLTAMSGETASFLVGGEFPIPISQDNNTITVAFKQYGVALAFVPTVMGEDRIRIKVRPEVSQLTTTGAVQISAGTNSISIPALTVRRAETTVELGSGQSFAIAGLLMDNTNQSTNALPGLGELPILGALFRSDNFLRNETELVIIVTPYIVRPTNDPNALRLPTDGFQPPSDIDRLLWLRQVGRATPDLAQRLPGQAGFVVE